MFHKIEITNSNFSHFFLFGHVKKNLINYQNLKLEILIEGETQQFYPQDIV